MASAEQLERRANRTRERLAERLDDLQYHTSPRMVAQDLLGAEVPRAAGDMVAMLSQQVRRNPLACMLIAAGVGWMIYSDAKARSRARVSTAAPSRRRRSRKTAKRRSRST